jgi:hypothetical protein
MPERIAVTTHPDGRLFVGNVELTSAPGQVLGRALRLSPAILEGLGYDRAIRLHRCKACGSLFLGHYVTRLCSDACTVANRRAWLDAHRPPPRLPSKAAQRRAALAAARCIVCDSPFTPTRLSARFCSNRCRQKHHRKAVMLRGRQFFEPADAEACFQKAGRVLDDTNFRAVADRLNFITEACVSAARADLTPTARERRRLFQLMEQHADRLLADFGLTSPSDSLLSNSVVNDMAIGVPPDDRRSRLLRMHMAREAGVPGKPMGEWRAVSLGLWGVQLIAHYAGLLAAVPAGRATREVPQEEIVLVAELHKLCADVTSDDRWQTTPVEGGPPSGLFVDLVRSVAAHIHDRLHLLRPPPPARLAKNLAALSGSPWRIADRIGRVLRMLASGKPQADD